MAIPGVRGRKQTSGTGESDEFSSPPRVQKKLTLPGVGVRSRSGDRSVGGANKDTGLGKVEAAAGRLDQTNRVVQLDLLVKLFPMFM